MTRASNGAACALLLAVLAVLTAAPAQAQAHRDWNRVDDTMEGALGLHYGKVGGHGLSFRTPLHWWLYLQVSGGVWHSADTRRHNVGAELQYLLRQDDRLRIFVAAGAGYFYRREKVGTDGTSDLFEKRKDWNEGAGIGVEVLQGERWSWLVEADFVHDGRNDEIKVAPQVGLYFYW